MFNRARGASIGVAFVLLFAGSAMGAFAQSAPVFVGGVITALSPTEITIIGADGVSKSFAVVPDTLVLQQQVTSLQAIAAGERMGVAAKRESDGSLTATYINIFSPQLWKIVKRGQFPMGSPDLLMTNAPVTRYEPSAGGGGLLTMAYGAGSYTITVPADCPIHRFVTRDLSNLSMGMFVTVRAGAQQSGGMTEAGSISYTS